MLAMLKTGYSSAFPYIPGRFSSSLAVWSAIPRTAYSFRVVFEKSDLNSLLLLVCSCLLIGSYLAFHYINSPLQMVHFHLESADLSLSKEGRGKPPVWG